MADAHAETRSAFTHRQILTIIVALMLGMFLAALDQTVVSTAIRTIADDLDGFSLQAWATTAFLITSTIATPLYGKLSDIYGRRPFFLTAITIFVIGSMLCGLAQSMYQLAIFRGIQGIGAGGLFPLAFAITGDIVPARERSRYQGYFMAVFATSSVLGPLIGGLLAGANSVFGIAGWRYIFYLNVPIGLVALFVVYRVLHVPHERHDHRIDWLGAFSLAACLVPLLIVAEQGREWGWGSAAAITCYAIGVVGLAAFIYAEHVFKDEALIPLRHFANKSFAVGTSGSLIVGIGMFGGMTMLPLYLQVVKGSSPTEAGLQTLPLVVGIMSAAMVSGRFISKTGRYKIFPVLGAIVMTVGLVLFSLIGLHTHIALVMVIMFVFGAGLGLSMQPIIMAVQNAVTPREIGVATSSVTFFRSVGGTVGVAVFLSILFTTLGGNIASSVAKANNTPTYQQALAAHPDQAQTLAGAGGSLDDTSFLNRIDDTIAAPFRQGFADSIDHIFLIAAGIMVIGLLIVINLPELPLRGMAKQQMEADGPVDEVATSLPH